MRNIIYSIDSYHARYSTYTKHAEKTADHITNLKMKSMAYDVAINDVNRQIERVKLMGDS
ncbi:hypothetical protein CS369_15555 [Candidatus Symbiopectobacterium sp. 'North America']|nr:hypothetical protein [Candidatus Symbiopectobacterium sp. 'North America']